MRSVKAPRRSRAKQHVPRVGKRRKAQLKKTLLSHWRTCITQQQPSRRWDVSKSVRIPHTARHNTLASEGRTELTLEIGSEGETPMERSLDSGLGTCSSPVSIHRDETPAMEVQKTDYIVEPLSKMVVSPTSIQQAVDHQPVLETKPRVYKLLPRDIEFCTYMMEHYGDDFDAMSKDGHNVYQDAAKGIARKLRIFKESPHYQDYLDSKST